MRCSADVRFAGWRRFLAAVAIASIAGLPAAIARADGALDNSAANVRPIPPPGIEIPAADRKELQGKLDELEATIRQLAAKNDARTQKLLPDVQIYAKAIRWALEYNEFFKQDEVAKAKKVVQEGIERANQLEAGKAPWATATGLVVRGYVSKIDGSVQPYGLVIPETYAAGGSQKHPLDIWFHGRGETLSELNFISDRERSPGQFTPPDTIVLHPYGRYCNAAKFAGETDVFEAMASVKERYPINDNRICERGFSMGGATAWHLAVHYPGTWAAANPGAGFAETPEFLRIFQHEVLTPTPYEEKLLHLYDSTDWAGNLFNCPVVAYSGEIDGQKQAADMMQKAMAREGLKMTYVIGPHTKHAYHPESAKIVAKLMADLVAKGRNRRPKEIHFTTYTLRYNECDWITIDLLGEHWRCADVAAKLVDDYSVEITTKNVAALSLNVPASDSPVRRPTIFNILIDGQSLSDKRLENASATRMLWGWDCSLRRINGKWQIDKSAEFPESPISAFAKAPPKRHGLQGPIDDAFMDSFIFVRPTGKSRNPKFEAWSKRETDRAIVEWRRQFRGEARVKDDTQITDSDMADANIVLWGDPTSNALLHRIAEKLPIQWSDKEIVADDRRFPADDHALILIQRNPLNPYRYVVLNSGFTYREYDYLNNARQIAKLPDWAIVNLDTPPDSQRPGKIVAADFFDEFWRLRK